MTNLEFLNQNIIECEKHIEHLETQIIEDKKYPSFVKAHKERIKELKLILKHLQQIKSVLEVWEVVENRLTIGAFIHMESISKDHPHYRIFEKALEVKDE